MARICAEGLRIEFPLYHFGSRSMKKRLLGAASRRVKADSQNRVVISALSDLSFTIESGERVALLGHNGAGKSTLLRTLAGIYEPIGGTLTVEGEIGSLIDPAAGMDILSTGRENIRLRALYRGLNAEQTAALEAEAGEFADLGEFLDMPTHGYSAGMSIRLAFALTTAIQPKILLMDEWLSAGDAGFIAKAEARLEQLIKASEIMVIATHDMNVVKRCCNRVIKLEAGQIVEDAPL